MHTFGLIGFPLGHSFSAKYFTEKFSNEGMTECQYLNFEINDIELIKGIISDTPSLHGFNVTIPYKQAIIPYLSSINEEAAAIGAINCVKVTEEGLIGYNTDVYGFTRSLLTLIQDLRPSALVLGTGGAAKAVCYALCQLGIDYIVVSRSGARPTSATPQVINKELQPTQNQLQSVQTSMQISRDSSMFMISYEQLTAEIVSAHKLIINCTPLGTYPKVDELPNIPYDSITKSHFLFDLVYNPPLTAFLNRGVEQRAQVCNGGDMLRFQADKSWDIWHSL